jgi:hypothetical protein
MAATQRYFDDLNALLAEMPLGTIDMAVVDANERCHGLRFFDPRVTVHQWLLDQQRRILTTWPSSRSQHVRRVPTQ